MRGSTLYAGMTIIGVTLLIFFLGIHPFLCVTKATRARNLRKAMVMDLGITDLCLFTEAPYTRNPALTDRHTPFRDHPMALEHFPSGTLISPPRRLSHTDHALD